MWIDAGDHMYAHDFAYGSTQGRNNKNIIKNQYTQETVPNRQYSKQYRFNS